MSPIRAAEKRRYPRNWREISKAIRFGRAGGRCECAGECGTGHDGRCEARHGQAHPVTGSTVVLTTAHLDHQPENCDPANLRAFCQRCHLAYDRALHAANAAWTRAGRPDTQLGLFDAPKPAAPAVGGADLRHAKHLTRRVNRRGPVAAGDVARLLGCDEASARLAIGIARRWGKVDVLHGFVVAVTKDEGSEVA